MPKKIKHPMQPLVWDGNVIRFKENKIVRYLLENGPNDLNKIAQLPFSKDDYTQFNQLIGYSVSGFGELSRVDPKTVEKADQEAELMTKNESISPRKS